MNFIHPDSVPEFSDVSHFAKWYLKNNMPLLLPMPYEVYSSDDATSMCLFRHKRYQFELYLIYPDPVIPLHLHPGVENIEVDVTSIQKAVIEKNVPAAAIFAPQPPDEYHGRSIKTKASSSGFMLFSAQKWDDGIEMSTIAARWKGHTAGPKHEALIRRFNPDCLIYPGYADVTQRPTSIFIS